mgnify:CR=1 FL=1
MTHLSIYYIARSRIPSERAEILTTLHTSDALAGKGCEVDIFLSSLKVTFEPSLNEFNKLGVSGYYGVRRKIPIHRVPVFQRHLKLFPYSKRGLIGWRIADLSFDPIAVLYVAIYMLSHGRPDALIIRGLPTTFTFLLFKHIIGVPIIYEAHHILNFQHDVNFRAKVREIFVLKNADGIIAVTENIKKLMVKMGIPQHKICIASTGASIEMFGVPMKKQAVRKQLMLPANCPIILYVGALYSYKGADILLRAFKKVREQVADAKLLIAGGLRKEEDASYIGKLIDDFKLRESVILTGYVPFYKVPFYIGSADIAVFAPPRTFYTEYCGESLKVWQYMAARKPIIASRLKSLEESLTHEVNALLVAPSDVNELSNTMIRLIKDQALAEALADRAFNDFKANYSWEKRGERIIEFIHRLLRR